MKGLHKFNSIFLGWIVPKINIIFFIVLLVCGNIKDLRVIAVVDDGDFACGDIINSHEVVLVAQKQQ